MDGDEGMDGDGGMWRMMKRRMDDWLISNEIKNCDRIFNDIPSKMLEKVTIFVQRVGGWWKIGNKLMVVNLNRNEEMVMGMIRLFSALTRITSSAPVIDSRYDMLLRTGTLEI